MESEFQPDFTNLPTCFFGIYSISKASFTNYASTSIAQI